MKIAILGGGSVGCAAAIELARAGHDVDVFEGREDILLGASRVNEGKIHQGFIYAKDDPELTARKMAEGAVEFRRMLARWVDTGQALRKSTPFLYARHRTSQLTEAELEAHFQRCCTIFDEVRAARGADYLGSDEPAGFSQLPQEEAAELVNPDHITTVYRTTEYGVDPRAISDALAEATRAEPRITLRCACQVTAVQRVGGGFEIGIKDAQSDGPYHQAQAVA
ncbi:MAG: FAD-dependent oxidoreductase [Pseudomonadota bacterium]